MMVRRFIGAALCFGGLAAWTSPPASAPLRYRIEVRTNVVQDLTVIGQGEQKQEFSNTGFVTVTASDSGGGQAVTLVLDSLVVGVGSPIPPDAAKTAAGTAWHGFRDRSGRVKDLKAENANPVIGAIEPALRQLFPPMKASTGAGQSWTDTTDMDNEGIAVRTVTNYVTSDDSLDGAKVVRLAGAFSSALSGQHAGPQGPVNIEGTATGTNTWVVGPDGACLAANSLASQSLSLTVAQLPAPIPVSVKTEATATLLK